MPRSLVVLGQVVRCRTVLRVEVAFAAFNLAEYGVWVTVLVYAYGHGGATATALVAVAQLVPAGLLAPTLTTVLQRHGASAALRRGYEIQAVSLTLLTASLLANLPGALVYATAVSAAIAVTVTRPAQAVLVPTIVVAPDELTAVNVVSGWVESVCILAGPAMAGLMIAVANPGATVGLFAAGTVVAAVVCPAGRAAAKSVGERPLVAAKPTDLDDVPAWPVVWLLGAEFAVIGMIDVLSVVLAVSVLALGPSGAGYLNAAFGAGGAAGAVIAATLIGHRRLTAPLYIAGAAWSAIMAALGLTLTSPGAFALLACAGSARAVLDASGRTILMRTQSAAARATLFGRLEAFAMLGLALGSLLVPALVAVGGASAALEGASALLAVATLANVTRLSRRRIVSEHERQDGRRDRVESGTCPRSSCA